MSVNFSLGVFHTDLRSIGNKTSKITIEKQKDRIWSSLKENYDSILAQEYRFLCNVNNRMWTHEAEDIRSAPRPPSGARVRRASSSSLPREFGSQIRPPSPARKRRASISSATKLPSTTLQEIVSWVFPQDKAALRKKNGGLWECIARKPVKPAGFIYEFKLRKEFNPHENPDAAYEKAQRKFWEIFPAAEPTPSTMRRNGFGRYRSLESCRGLGKYPEEFKKLGYSGRTDERKGFILTFPDQDALQAKWHLMQDEDPEIAEPDLNIMSGSDLAGNMEFVEAYITHDALLSDGKEFIHDHIAHILPTITCMFDSDAHSSGYSMTYKDRKYSRVKTIIR